MSCYKRVYAKVNLDAILFNLESMKRHLKADTKIIAVIKTDGYGHGAVPIAKELDALEYIWGYATATADEALNLRENGIQKPILILGYTFPEDYETLIKNDIRMAVFRKDSIPKLVEASQKVGKKALVHIKVDTGMGRIGIFPDETGLPFIKELMEQKEIEIEGMLTHFAKADETDKSYTESQLAKYNAFAKMVEQTLGLHIPVKHCSNSAGIIAYPQANMDVVRAGITVYGLWPSDEVSKTVIPLQPAMELKSSIVYLKSIPAGTQISYGGTYTADSRRMIATIPVGYGDGYPRSLSQKGFVLIQGKRAPIVGRVCMDQFMVDVTDMKGVKEGDEVTLLGKDGTECITAEEIGSLSGRFNYEFVCCLSKRIPRVYIRNQQEIGSKNFFHESELS